MTRLSGHAITFTTDPGLGRIRLGFDGTPPGSDTLIWPSPRTEPDAPRSSTEEQAAALLHALQTFQLDPPEQMVLNFPGAAVQIAPDGHVVVANDAFVALTGVPLRVITALNVLADGDLPRTMDTARRVARRLMNEDPPCASMEARPVSPLGSAVVQRWRAVAIGPAGARTALFGFGEDLALDASEHASVQRALNTVGIGVVDWSVSQRRLYADARAMAVLGINRIDSPDADGILSWAHPDDRAGAAEALCRTVAADELLEYRFRAANTPTERWIDVVAGRSGGPEDAHVTGLLRDVTRAVHEQRGAQERTALLDTIASQMPVGLFLVDANGVVRLATGTLLDELGIDGSRLQGRSVLKRFQNHPVLVQHLDAALAGQSSKFRLEVASRWLEVALVATSSRPAPNVRVIGVAMDVTAQIARDAEQQRNERQEAAYLLIAGLAHDFNNLLTVMLSYTDFALQSDIDPASLAARDLQRVRAAGEQASKLVRRILSVGRDPEPDGSPIDAPATLASMYETMRRMVGTSPLAMQFESTPPIMLARTELEHAMYNLLLNARDASPPGAGITIACGTRVIGPDTKVPLNPGVYAELSVIDRGPGLSPARLAEAIAERKSTKGPHRGSGLGLSTVHALATRRGGTLISEPGEVPGARMTLLLPAVSEPHLRDAAALVVDADPDVRNIVARTLERDWKMTAATADRAEIGHLGPFSIAVVSAAAIDPATLSTLPSLQGVPTLILLPAETPIQPSDAHLYLAKPFSAEQLSRALRRLLMPR